MPEVTYDFTGRSVIVTGGARGIGTAIAQRFADAGAEVAIWDLSPEAFDATQWKPAHLQAVDVADHDSVAGALDATIEALGHIDILVNNAGINGPVANVAEYDPAAWRRVLDINLTGVFNTSNAVIPQMARGASGRIINIASIAGKEGNPGIAAYSASKAGVIGFTKALAKEVVGQGITVNAIAPAITQTDLFAQMTQDHIDSSLAKIPMGRFLQVDEIAALAAWIASDQCSFTTGFTFDISGGRATY